MLPKWKLITALGLLLITFTLIFFFTVHGVFLKLSAEKAMPDQAKESVPEFPNQNTSEQNPNIVRLEQLLHGSFFPDPLNEWQNMGNHILQNADEFCNELHKVLAADTDNLLVLVDKSHYLAESYKPADITALTTDKSYLLNKNGLALRSPLLPALEQMAFAAGESGVKLVVSSSFRSYDYQKRVYANIVAEMGQEAADRESSRPGASQHQLGTVIDFGSISDEYAETAAGKWLTEHAAEFGFSLSFPQGYEAVTGYRWECWHYRYIGVPAVRFQQRWFNNIQQYMLEFIHAWRSFE